MKIRPAIFIAAPVLLITFVISCSKTTEEFQSEPLSDYIPLEVGKYITYRVDSLVFTNLGRTEEIHKYQMKHVVDAQINDNLGRPAYRIITYISDSTGTQPWTPNGTYFITPLSDQVEVIENNLRSIKLHLPIKANFNWKGNKYYPDDPYDALCALNSFDGSLSETDYFYDGDRQDTEVINGQTYNNVYTVQQDDESNNYPNTDPGIFALRAYGIEKYAKGIGLVYREQILWEYQPNTGGSGGGYKCGFGVTMWMIDNN